MPKYRARHLCRNHKWIEISSGYDAREGIFWHHYACTNCDNIKTICNPNGYLS